MVLEEDWLRIQTRPIDNRPVTQVDVDGTQLDVESNFCYLGDMPCAGGGCKLAIVTRCSTAWGKFKRLLPILTSKHEAGRSSPPVYVLPYCMVVKPGHLWRQRPNKTWSECVKTDMKMCSLGSIDPLNREAWGLGVRHSSHLLPTPVPGTPAAVEK